MFELYGTQHVERILQIFLPLPLLFFLCHCNFVVVVYRFPHHFQAITELCVCIAIWIVSFIDDHLMTEFWNLNDFFPIVEHGPGRID